MITQQDLKQAIAECQGQRNPNASTCIKLAAFLTIQRELYGEEKDAVQLPSYSFASAPEEIIFSDGESEFARAIDGKHQADVIPVLDELMTTLQIIQPRLYNAVMDKLTPI